MIFFFLLLEWDKTTLLTFSYERKIYLFSIPKKEKCAYVCVFIYTHAHICIFTYLFTYTYLDTGTFTIFF